MTLINSLFVLGEINEVNDVRLSLGIILIFLGVTSA